MRLAVDLLDRLREVLLSVCLATDSRFSRENKLDINGRISAEELVQFGSSQRLLSPCRSEDRSVGPMLLEILLNKPHHDTTAVVALRHPWGS